MIRRAPLGLLLLALAAVAAAALGGAGAMVVALERAETQFDAVLDEKALSRALRVRRDLELALRLDIPLADIRGMWDYTAAIPEADPDIRFVAVTGPDLKRLHYGGIGRARLDPMLADPAVRAAADDSLERPVTPADAVMVGGFAITTLPLLKDGEAVGFVHVAVQHKQLRERLYGHAGESAPLTALALLLVLEIAGFAYAAGYREPLERLRGLLDSAERSDGSHFELSGRHAGGELGAAMFRFNALMHRLSRRAGRFLGYAQEVRRAVFEPAVASQVAALAAQSELGADADSGPRLLRRADARPSDLRPALVLGVAVAVGLTAALALASPGPDGAAALLAAAGALAGAAAALLVLPLAAALATVLMVVSAALVSFAAGGAPTGWPAALPIVPSILLPLAGGILAGLAGRYARQQGLRPGRAWLALRLATGGALGLLAAVALGTTPPLSVGAALALALGVGSVLLRPAVRRLALGGPRAAVEQTGEAD